MRKASRVASLALFAVLVAAYPGAMVAAARDAAGTDGGLTPTVSQVTCPADPLTANSGILGAVPGGTATASITIAAGCSVDVSLVSYEAPSASFTFESAGQQVLFGSQTVSGAGLHTLSVNVPNCFFQVDLVFGQPITNLGPADSNNFYFRQGRLIAGVNGGTTACVHDTEESPPPIGTVTTPPVVVTPVVVTTPTIITMPTIITPPALGTMPTIFTPPSLGTTPTIVAVTPTTPARTTPTTGTVAGVQGRLPSTSTAVGGPSPVAAVGMLLVMFGVLLLRLGTRPAR